MARYGKVQANQYNNSANVGQVASLAADNGKAIGWSGGAIANLDVPQKQTAQRGIVTQHFQSIVGMTATVPLSADTPFYFNNSGAGAGITQNTNANLGTMGVITCSTGTTANGVGAILARQGTSGLSTLVMCNPGDVWTFRSRFRIPVLSDAAQPFAIGLGFLDQLAGTVTNAVYLATNGVGSPLVGACRAAGVTTTTATIISPVANTWYDLEIIYTTDLCTFTVGGQTKSNTSTIPQGAAQRIGYGVGVSKQALGVVARTIDVDYIQVEWDLA